MNEDKNLSGYVYDLPEGKIANYPTSKRSDSKLLYYDGTIQHSTFKKIDSHLPKGSLLVFNDTKVIPARILFTKSTGALIEIFLLNPVSPSEDMAIAMAQKESCTWKCFIGNMKRWKNDSLSIKTVDFELNAKLEDSENQLVKFSWTGQNTFGEILEILGNIPLPPYIKRKLLPEDKERYQTIYSAVPGAVAAPTAGLHFTNEIMSDLKKNHKIEYVTLHVGAGTFQPVKTKNFMDHEMHSEVFIIKKSTIQSIVESTSVISVGTTSLRTLESLYWFGIKLMRLGINCPFVIEKSDIDYQRNDLPDYRKVFQHILENAKFEGDFLTGKTGIFIYPGYDFKVVNGLITNFHLPGSTLILLIAAFVGEDWKKIYQSALDNDYRFLSYGDSSLLLPKKH